MKPCLMHWLRHWRTTETELAGQLRGILSQNALCTNPPEFAELHSESDLLKLTGTVAEASFNNLAFLDIELSVTAESALISISTALPEGVEQVQAMMAIYSSGVTAHRGTLRLSALLRYAQAVGLDYHHVLFALMKAGEFSAIKGKIAQRLLDIFTEAQGDEVKESIAILSIEVLKSNILRLRRPVAVPVMSSGAGLWPCLCRPGKHG